MDSPQPEITIPSLLDAKAVGGLDGWSGFSAQVRYIAAQLARWFRMPDVTGFSPERDEDVDVFRKSGVVDYHQVKTGLQTASSTREIVAAFVARHENLITAGRVGRLVIASPSPNDQVRSAGKAVARFRDLGTADPQREATRADLRTRLVSAGVVRTEDCDFAIEHLDLMHDWGGLEPEHEPWGRIAGDLGGLPELHGLWVIELQHAAKALAQAIDQRKRHRWTRDEVVALVQHAVAEWRQGPPRASGDVILLCHQSLEPARSHPDRESMPERLRDCRVLPFVANQAELMGSRGWRELPESIASLFEPLGPFQAALAKGKSAPVVYYGFPHVPLAALAGFLMGGTAEVHLIDCDHDSKQFAWPRDDANPQDLHVAQPTSIGRGAAIVRVSISARVAAADCQHHGGDPVAVEFDFRLDAPMRGVVRREGQARAYARTIRQTLDQYVGGSRDVSSLHVFAAVPVSVAFLIGQVAASTGYPDTWIYNYRYDDRPRYRWALNLRRAQTADGLVLLGG